MKKNPSAFLECLTKALYTNLDPETTEDRQLLMNNFFLSATPSLRLNLDVWRMSAP